MIPSFTPPHRKLLLFGDRVLILAATRLSPAGSVWQITSSKELSAL